MLALLLIVPLLLVSPTVRGVGKQPPRTNGPYPVVVRGSCEGEGRAVVAAGKIHIHAVVTDEAGNRGALTANNLTLSGPHFEGRGMVMGKKATFTGRLDGYDGDKHFKGARLLCNYTDATGRSGRVAGTLE